MPEVTADSEMHATGAPVELVIFQIMVPGVVEGSAPAGVSQVCDIERIPVVQEYVVVWVAVYVVPAEIVHVVPERVPPLLQA